MRSHADALFFEPEQSRAAPDSLVSLLRSAALQCPDAPAYTFLRDGETPVHSLTYGQLDKQAAEIGRRLHARGLAGERALLAFPPGLDFIAAFFGCLYAGVIAVIVPAPTTRRRHLAQMLAVVADARPAIALATPAITAAQSGEGAEVPGLSWMAIPLSEDAPEAGAAFAPLPGRAGLNTLAYLQYTSGSTSDPKGVMITHGNVLDNCRDMDISWEHTPESRHVSWLPHFHDMGLVFGILLPLYKRAPCTLMSPAAFVQRPARWLEAISRGRATHSAAPNFAFDLCAQKVSSADREALDLSCWQVALNAAEPVRSATVRRFAETFGPVGFSSRAMCPGYGLAESTLVVTKVGKARECLLLPVSAAALEQDRFVPAAADGDGAQTLVGCGGPAAGTEVRIVDPVTRVPCPPGVIGEIWIRSSSNARGYWNKSQATEETFDARMQGETGGPCLRTGDLGALHEGNLFITGRHKDLVVIRGANYYPQDFEMTAQSSHPLLRLNGGAAFAVTVEDEERLVVVQEVEKRYETAGPDALFSAIRQAISAEHGVSVQTIVLIKLGTLPKTSSGKVQRRLCRALFLSGSLEAVGRRDLSEAPPPEELPGAGGSGSLLDALRLLVSRRTRIPARELDCHAPVRGLGIDSLAAVEITNELRIAWNRHMPISRLLGDRTLAEIAVEWDAAPPDRQPDLLAPTDSSVHAWPLTAGQMALWAIHQQAPSSSAYHIACALRLPPSWTAADVRRAAERLAERHPNLRCRFPTRRGKPTATVDEASPLSFTHIDAADWDEHAIADRLRTAAWRPFDLARGPLFRLHYLAAADAPVLLLCMHHIISDYWSLTILLKELCLLIHSAHELPPLRFHYSDYAAAQQEYLQSEEALTDLASWKAELGGLPILSLPTDRPRPAVQTGRGATASFRIPESTLRRLRELSLSQGVTLFMLLLAAYAVFLRHAAGQDDLVVGVPTSGRSRAEWSGIVGYFVNTAPIRVTIDGDLPFTALLRSVRAAALRALERQDYPFPLLADALKPARDRSRSPVFQTMFVWQKSSEEQQEIPAAVALGSGGERFTVAGRRLETVALAGESAQCDLTLTMGELGDELGASWKYSTDLFDPGTITRMGHRFQALLAHLPLLGEMPLSEFRHPND